MDGAGSTRSARRRLRPRAGHCVSVGAFWSSEFRPMRSDDWSAAIAFRPARAGGAPKAETRVRASEAATAPE